MERIVRIYTPAFKARVIQEIADKKFLSFGQAAAFYKINGSCTLQRWARSMGREDLLPKIVVRDV